MICMIEWLAELRWA